MTRRFGGISSAFIARVSRQLFPYKPFADLKVSDRKSANIQLPFQLPEVSTDIPEDGNSLINMSKWTQAERLKLEKIMEMHARWIVDFVGKFIASTACEKQTTNKNSICDECQALAKDESLKRSLRRKNLEASLPEHL